MSRLVIRTPCLPRVVTMTPTRSRIWASVRPDFDPSRSRSYSLVMRYEAPSIRVRISSPSIRAICCDGSATNAYPRSRHSWVWRTMPAGSFGLMMTRSSPPSRWATGSSSMLRASLMAPA
jgi:hypothetical protein